MVGLAMIYMVVGWALIDIIFQRIPGTPPSQNSPNIDQRGSTKVPNGRSRSSSSSSGGGSEEGNYFTCQLSPKRHYITNTTGLREVTERRFANQEKAVNPGEGGGGGGRGAVLYGGDQSQKMVLHQHQAKTCERTALPTPLILTVCHFSF